MTSVGDDLLELIGLAGDVRVVHTPTERYCWSVNIGDRGATATTLAYAIYLAKRQFVEGLGYELPLPEIPDFVEAR